MQPTFFDFQNRWEDLRQMQPAQILVRLNEVIDWEIFREELETMRNKERKSAAGRKPYDVILMFKILILQSLVNLSDAQVEFQIRDRITFMEFLGLNWQSRIPDEKTVWLFREQLKKAGLLEPLFERFEKHLVEHGLEAKRGQMIDATMVQTPIPHNTPEEKATLKEGKTPETWSNAKSRQKDRDARWAKKGSKSYHGTKNHANVDAEHKIIRSFTVTPASVHDSQVFDEVLEPSEANPEVYADSAYRSEETEKKLEKNKYTSHVHERAYRNKPLTESQKGANRIRSRTRARVEHVFGIQFQIAGNLVLRTIGLSRARVKIGLRNLSYNLQRFSYLKTSGGKS